VGACVVDVVVGATYALVVVVVVEEEVVELPDEVLLEELDA